MVDCYGRRNSFHIYILHDQEEEMSWFVFNPYKNYSLRLHDVRSMNFIRNSNRTIYFVYNGFDQSFLVCFLNKF